MMRKYYRFDCDRCGRTVYVPGGHAAAALARIRKRGWKMGKHHRCFACVKAKVPDVFAELFDGSGPRPQEDASP